MTPVLFDPAKDNLATLAALHRTSFAKAWDAAAIADLLAGPGVFAFQLSDGFILARVAAGEAEILTLAVTPTARGKGLGRALLQAAVTQAEALGAQSVFLEVGTDNPAALALYAGMGFVQVGQRKGYYVSPAAGAQDALVLRRALSPGKNFA
jgi:ribosomal-protein-alanine N-acetyltransferase